MATEPETRRAPPFTAIVDKLPSTVPFVGPETQERNRGRPFRARIGANESVFGPSPKAVAAMERAAAEAWKYCDPENHDLKQALAAHHGVRAREHRRRRGHRRALRVRRAAVRRARRHRRHLARRLSDLQFPVAWLWRPAGHDALCRRPRGSALAARPGHAREGAPDLLRQPRQPHGHLVGRGGRAGPDRARCPRARCSASTRPIANSRRPARRPPSTSPTRASCASAPSRRPTAWPAPASATPSARPA